MTETITDSELAAWARNWHWNDCAGDKPVDPSIYFRDMRMLKAFITQFRPAVTQPAWDAYWNRSYGPVETRAAEIYGGFEYNEPGAKPNWIPGGNSLKQDEARVLARRELHEAGHTPSVSRPHLSTPEK